MKIHAVKRMVALLLAFVLVSGYIVPVHAAGGSRVTLTQVDNDAVSASLLHRPSTEEEAATYAEHDPVRVSIVLEEASTLEAGYSTDHLAANTAAMTYRSDLLEDQQTVTRRIEKTLKEPLDVVWNLTLAANIISANVEYGQIDQIAAVKGVEKVVIERTYKPLESVSSAEAKPNMVISAGMTGANQVWDTGYYGAGTRIAVIDTGLDVDHQSFDPEALKHAYEVSAEKAGKTYEEYVASLHLLTKEEIAEKLPQLNIHKLMPDITADDLYVNLKAPFGINYIDQNKIITHDNDSASEHGSHVSGISSGNRFLQKDGQFVSAADTVYTLGNAPDSQIIVMKVFGENSPTDADYMAALEDAIMLDCDVANLSLGGSNPGGTISLDYQDIMDSLVNTDTVVAIAAGNEGPWSAHSNGVVPNLYVEDVSMHTSSEPSTYQNSLSVASVDNNGSITTSLLFQGRHLGYVDGKGDYHDPFATLDRKGDGSGTEYDYVMLTGTGKDADYEGINVAGKIVLVSRGDTNFTEKADTAVEHGALATLVCNNTVDNTIMVLDGYWESEPCAMISKEAGEIIKAGSTEQKTEAGLVYYTGKLSVDSRLSPIANGHDYFTMSAFSSWGVPGDLSMKPEIAAPGGNIYSVNGAVPETDQYELMSGTSMATPQVAGISALVMEHIRKDGLQAEGLTNRGLAQAIMMSTADPMRDFTGNYIPILQQGSGLANIRDAVSANAFITVTDQADGKAKVELGDDPQRTGSYTFSFDIHSLCDEDQRFELSADLFTQDTFEDYANKAAQEAGDQSQMATYMAMTTRLLDSRAVWTVNGQALGKAFGNLEGCDFDGSGVVTEKDAQALLDYVTGLTDSISNEDKADLNGDGQITTYDVHKFLTALDAGTVTVPGGETVTVTVTLSMTDEAKAYVDETYPNGAYMQGYVYANGQPTYEGAEGTQLNIPVLGFYGSWTDPSMFEIGSTQEKLSGTEIRATYTGEGEDAEGEPASYNTLEVEYYRDPGYSYLLGGNPVDPSEKPNPQRTAINNQNGDRIHSFKFSPIRNAAASRVQLTDSEGNVLWNRYSGAYPGAYYGIMMFFPMWINTNFRHPINFVPNTLKEGERFTASITLAPEYNTDMKTEQADWDSLGHGATLSSSLMIDNTAPVIQDVVLSDDEKPTITVTASDNQYIAGVALFDRSGRTVLSSCGSVADAKPGDVDEFTLSTAKANGKKFLVQVFDYAYNVSTYELKIELGEPVPLPQLIAHDLEYADYGPGYWTGFQVNSSYRDLGTYAKSPVSMKAATMADPYIYTVSLDNVLYVLHKEDLLAPIRVGKLSQNVEELAYSRADGKLYAVYQTADSSVLATMDPMTGALTEVGTLGVRTNTLAINADGLFYCNELETSKLYTYTLDTLSAPVQIAECLGDGEVPFPAKGIQSMEFDPNTGNVIWISFTSTPSSWGGTTDTAYLYEIKPDHSVVRHEDLMHHLVALIIPEKGVNNPDFELTDTVSSLNLTDETVYMMKSQAYQLSADVLPWNASDRFVFWESDNEEVASVDGKGLVTALGVGTAVITAASRLNPALTDSVTIHVSDIKVTVDGILSDVSGKPSTFTWDLEKANDWEVGMDLDTDVLSATAKDDWTYFVTSGTGKTMKKIDFGSSEVLSSWNRIMSDLAYSPVFSGESDLVHMISMTMWLPCKDLSAKPDGNAWDLSSVLEQNSSEANEFVGIASGGAARYVETDGVEHDAEILYLLDNAGGVLKLYCYEVSPESADYDPLYPYNAGAEYFESDLIDEGYTLTYYNDAPLSSLVVGDDGNLYFSGYNGSSSELYQLRLDAETGRYDATRFANMGEGVWPVALTKVTANVPEEAPAAASVHAADLAVPSLNAKAVLKPQAAPAPAPAPVHERLEEVTVTIPADELNNTNGLLTLTYDPAAMELKSVSSAAYMDARIEEEGKLVYGYANISAPAKGSDLLTLTFTPKADGKTELTVETSQRNDKVVSETKTLQVNLMERCPSESFTDVHEDSWFHEAVDYVVEKGLMKGLNATAFGAYNDMTRAQLVTVLYRMAGCPAVSGKAPFVDVASISYYADAVAWAYENQITLGTDRLHFSPNALLSREQIVVLLSRYAEFAGRDVSVKGDLSAYADARAVSPYAVDAMVWAAETGILTGVDKTHLDPKGTATRAQIASVLMRFDRLAK